MVRFRNPVTNETASVRFKKRWLFFTPLFIVELWKYGFIISGLLSIVPLFAIIFMFRHNGMVEGWYRRNGWIEVNEFGQSVGLATGLPSVPLS